MINSIDLNKIYNEDCWLTMKRMPSNFVDLVVTSPPYNCGIKYDIYNDNILWKDYLKWCFDWMRELYRIVKEDGRICVNVLVEMGINDNKNRVSPMIEFYKIIKRSNFNIFGMPMWVDTTRVKNTAWGSWLMASSPYIYNPFEVVLIAYKKEWKKRSKGESTINKEDFINACSGRWHIRPETKQKTKANFPIELPKLCINLLSYKGDLIYDPFMGGGTTAVASKFLGRKYIGSEISKEYCQIAERRIKNTNIDNRFFKRRIKNTNIDNRFFKI